MRITLASTSPRRAELIKQLGYDTEIVPPDCDEEIECRDPDILVAALAEKKALSVTGELVIGADTVVVAPNGKMLGKPKDATDAKKMLKLLCGHRHKVVTGVCVKYNGRVITSSQTTYITFRPYESYIVDKYIEDGKSFGKAGAYGIQDPEIASMVKEIEGDEDNVIGLPLNLTKQMIESIQST